MNNKKNSHDPALLTAFVLRENLVTEHVCQFVIKVKPHVDLC